MSTGDPLNPSQTIFVVFFAIFWGTAANAWPRWKAFHWTFISDPRIGARVLSSFLVLNVVPIAFFVCVLLRLKSQPHELATTWPILKGVIPALGIFGIYRLWIAAVAFRPERFYYTAAELRAHPQLAGTTEPARDSADLKLTGKNWWVDALVGVVYVCLGLVA